MADLPKKPSRGKRPVVAPGRLDELEEWFASGVTLDAVDPFGRTLLYLASRAGQLELVAWLLERGADPTRRILFDPDLSAPPSSGAPGDSATVAVDRAKLDAFVEQLEREANATRRETPRARRLAKAIVRGAKDEAERLLADPPSALRGQGRWFTPLHAAAYRDHAAVVERLVRAGAPVEFDHAKNRELARPDPHRAENPLFLAVERDNVAAVRALVDLGARPGLGGGNLANTSPLQRAVELGRSTIVRLLEPTRAELPATRNVEKVVLLLVACESGDLQSVKALVAEGLDVNAVAPDGRMPALAAIREGGEEVVAFLLSNDLVVTDSMITNAVLRRLPGIARALVESPNPKKVRKSAIRETRTMARERGMPDVAALLGKLL